jgi:hypothetical protein
MTKDMNQNFDARGSNGVITLAAIVQCAAVLPVQAKR